MNNGFIVTSYTVIDDILRAFGHEEHVLSRVSDAEILTIAVIAAKYFRNNHERAVCMMLGLGYLA